MPQRFLRPGIRTSPRWNSISHTACRLFVSIMTQVDDYGRYDGRNSILWSDAFAVWNEQNPHLAVTAQDSAALCGELSNANLVSFYETNGRRYLQIEQWEERTRGPSKWPDPKSGNRIDFTTPQPIPAESCGILRNPELPQPIPASLASVPSHEPEPLHHPKGDGDFEKFWEVYPRKVGKKEAQKAFSRVKGVSIEKIMSAVESQKNNYEWKKEGGQFVPHPSTWLNRGSWDDHVEEISARPKPYVHRLRDSHYDSTKDES